MHMLDELELHKMIAIVRGLSEQQGDRTAEALYAGGVRFLEVTLNTDGWTTMISNWRQRYDGKMRIGAGTVLDLEMAKEAYAAGAEFLVTPNTDLEVIDFAVNKGIAVFPGALTPSEIVQAWKAGATAVKLFPMSSLGLSYFKEIRAPLDRIRLVPTGGIHLDNIKQFVQAGAFALGMGSGLVSKEAVTAGRYSELTERAKALAAAIQEAAK